MKKEYFGIIYKATFSNGKCYIGQTTRGLSSRKRDHITSAGTENVAFHNAINKYGKEDLVWEVIDTANSIEELNEKEFFWIDYYNSYTHLENSNGYNMTLGGNSTLGWIPTDETKEKISKANTGNFAGEKNNQYGKTGELSTWWGRKHTEEEKRKISESNKGKKKRARTKNEKEHLRKLLKGRIPPNKYTYNLLNQKYPLLFSDHEIKEDGSFIKVRCKECNLWFIPERYQINEKIRQLKFGTGLRFLFCSEDCKSKSSIYCMKKDPKFLSKYKRYCRDVEFETRKNIKKYHNKIKNFNLRSYYYHLDHKYSMYEGFKNKVSPEIIGHWRNLEIVSKFKNESKSGKCTIKLKELKELIK